MKRMRRSDAGAIALAVAVLAGLIVSLRPVDESAYTTTGFAAADRQQSVTSPAPLALFIGDSYTAGDGSAELSYGCRAAVQLGWLCALSARGGTGYISGGVANRWIEPYTGKSLSFGERIPHLAAQYDPAYVVLDGGRNDLFPPREDTYAEMVSAIGEARRTWPRAQIVFIRPRFLANPADDLGFDDRFMHSLEAEPAARGVTFIDPLHSLSGADTSALLSDDGIHPNPTGEIQMAATLFNALHPRFPSPVGAAG